MAIDADVSLSPDRVIQFAGMLAATTFRRIALGMTGAVEGAHMDHPDFRANGKIFATIQTDERGMVKLTPDQQRRFVADHPEAFVPENGAWGRQGSTRVLFVAADDEVVGEAMTLAWQNTASARPGRASKATRGRRRRGGGLGDPR